MKNMRVKTLMVLFVAAVTLNFAGAAYADDVVHKMGKKLYRGVMNSASGWVEVPKAIYDETKAHDPATGLVWGSIKGSGMAVARTGAGAYEAGTFLFPVPSEYKPVLEPEYVF